MCDNSGMHESTPQIGACSWADALDQLVDQRFPSLVSLRRQLHQSPEPSGEERETSLRLYQDIGSLGPYVQLGPDGIGVIADWDLDQLPSGFPLLALRADIDALRIHDEKDVAYRSKKDGLMHACGHDVHTTIMSGVVATICQMKKQGSLPWPVPLRTIFQPAEEICQGADAMIKAGALDGVGAILATHVEPRLPVGTIGFREGVLTASCDEMRIQIVGQGGHAARPHESRDPICAAAALIQSLYLQIPRATDSLDSVVVTVGKIVGGHNFNVIPERVTLEGTVRTLDTAVRDNAVDHIRRIAAGVGQTSDTEITVEFGLNAPPVTNDARIIRMLQGITHEVYGPSAIRKIIRPSMGSEDFAFYLKTVPGAMLRIGVRSDAIGRHGLHTSLFDIDEEAMRVAIRVLARACIRWYDPDSPNPISLDIDS